MPVSDVSLSPIQEEYYPGDTIICSATGNPEPYIRWVDIFNNTVSDSPTLLIVPSMAGTQTFTCLATNVIDNETYMATATITFDVVGTYHLK